MDDFAGSEPLVGEIVGLRTFRVDETGLLLPLFSEGCWYDGTNTALCGRQPEPAPAHPRRAGRALRVRLLRLRLAGGGAAEPRHALRPGRRLGVGQRARRHQGRAGRARAHRGAVAAPVGAGLAAPPGRRPLPERPALRRPRGDAGRAPAHPAVLLRAGRPPRRGTARRWPRSAWSPPWRWVPCRTTRCTRSARSGTSGSWRRPAWPAPWRGSRSAPASPGTARPRCWWWACSRG